MNGDMMLVLVLLLWVSVGPILAVVMARRGHSPAGWGILGTLLGPLALPIAMDARGRRRDAGLAVLTTGSRRSGPVSVLAGIDGSDEAREALRRAVDLLGDRIGRLSLVTVVSYDALDDRDMLADEEATAQLWMTAARASVPGIVPDEYVVPGPPAPALIRLAVEGDYDLVVIGSRGRGMTPRLFGSVAGALAASSPISVLVGGRGRGPGSFQDTDVSPARATDSPTDQPEVLL